MAELVWTSFDKLAKIFKMPTPKDDKIHPNKTVALYKWLLKNYTKQGDKILDTHFWKSKYRYSLPRFRI